MLKTDTRKVLLGTGAILLLPLLGMQLSNEITWSLFDFVAAALLLGGTGMLFVLLARKVPDPRHRTYIGVGIALLLAIVWVQLAVGIVDLGPFTGS